MSSTQDATKRKKGPLTITFAEIAKAKKYNPEGIRCIEVGVKKGTFYRDQGLVCGYLKACPNTQYLGDLLHQNEPLFEEYTALRMSEWGTAKQGSSSTKDQRIPQFLAFFSFLRATRPNKNAVEHLFYSAAMRIDPNVVQDVLDSRNDEEQLAYCGFAITANLLIKLIKNIPEQFHSVWRQDSSNCENYLPDTEDLHRAFVVLRLWTWLRDKSQNTDLPERHIKNNPARPVHYMELSESGEIILPPTDEVTEDILEFDIPSDPEEDDGDDAFPFARESKTANSARAASSNCEALEYLPPLTPQEKQSLYHHAKRCTSVVHDGWACGLIANPHLASQVMNQNTNLEPFPIAGTQELEANGTKVDAQPPVNHINAVLLRFNVREQLEYCHLHASLTKPSGTHRGASEEDGLDIHKIHTLATCSICPKFKSFYNRVNLSSKKVRRVEKIYREPFHGLEFFLKHCHAESEYQYHVPRTRLTRALELQAMGPVNRYITKLVYEICELKDERLVMVAQHIPTAWLATMVVENWGVPTAWVRHGMSQLQKDSAILQFNDPHAKLRVLVLNEDQEDSVSALHLGGCHYMIVLELPDDINAFNRMVNRLNTAGSQKNDVFVWQLTVNHTLHRWSCGNFAKKAISDIAGGQDGMDEKAEEVLNAAMDWKEGRSAWGDINNLNLSESLLTPGQRVEFGCIDGQSSASPSEDAATVSGQEPQTIQKGFTECVTADNSLQQPGDVSNGLPSGDGMISGRQSTAQDVLPRKGTEDNGVRNIPAQLLDDESFDMLESLIHDTPAAEEAVKREEPTSCGAKRSRSDCLDWQTAYAERAKRDWRWEF
ncbi:hypothetical protein FQN52_007618 [Onygenales sp. PD_12]|nr:hypothetical protein FQN52_007618 [Onygenales sp. PD_12]